MTSIRILREVDDWAREFEDAEPHVQRDAMLALAEYGLARTFEEWCDDGDEQPTDEALDRYIRLHAFYAALWNRVGAERFFKMIHAATHNVLVLRRGK